jgi:hypothetical protein
MGSIRVYQGRRQAVRGVCGAGDRAPDGAVRVTVNFAEDPAAAAANDLFACVADLAKHLGRALGRAGGAGLLLAFALSRQWPAPTRH